MAKKMRAPEVLPIEEAVGWCILARMYDRKRAKDRGRILFLKMFML